MKTNKYSGVLIAFDGPNGAGKSTLIEHVNHELGNHGLEVYVTKEPTDTKLGSITRQIVEDLDGESLACLVAADRYQHLKETIIPLLELGRVVITDRYVLSSLILQCMDGVESEFVFAVNSNIIAPDLQIAVNADTTTLQTRLNERNELTRFERGQRSLEESRFTSLGITALRKRNVSVLEVNNAGDITESVSIIVDKILEVSK
jgi:dTMP kinase